MRTLLLFSSLALACGSALHLNMSHVLSRGGPVMVISGISSRPEFCLAASGRSGAHASLVPCADAIRAGDGRELFTFDGGRLRSEGAELCLGSTGEVVAEAHRLEFVRCDGAGTSNDAGSPSFELRGNGQIRIASTEACLSQAGHMAGPADVALHSAAWATSSLANEHSAAMAVDGLATYWASKLDPELPVDLVLELGASEELQVAEIDWEYPAKAFSVLLSIDGVRWEEVYATDANSLHAVRIPLGSKAAAKVKVSMQEPHPVYGTVHGRRVFAVSRVGLYAERLRTIAEPCAEAARSTDARDKYFVVSASVHEGAVWGALAAEKQHLDTASKALATTVVALHKLSPHLVSCATTHGLHTNLTAMLGHRQNDSPSLRRVAADTGTDFDGAERLLQEARDVIIGIRKALK